MEILGWILCVSGLLLGSFRLYEIRTYVRTGQRVQQRVVNQTMLILAAVVTVPLLDLSPLHLLWLFPVAFIVGMLSLAFPFSLVSLVGKPFGRICCLGLDRVAVRTRPSERFREFFGLSPEEVKEQVTWERA